jgi:multiple antibiotic resistance protein
MEDFFSSVFSANAALFTPLSLLLASYTSIFSIANPLAAMPVFLSLTEDNTNEERQELSKWASSYMFIILLVFLLAGTYILKFFGISLPGIRIAGGLMIMRAAYSMLSPEEHGEKLTDEDKAAARQKEDISFSPLAMPLLSGPGSIAVVISLASQAKGVVDYIVISVSILLVAITSYLVLRVAPAAVKYVGQTGMTVMTRMMGFIALAIGVQFIINGIGAFFELT